MAEVGGIPTAPMDECFGGKPDVRSAIAEHYGSVVPDFDGAVAAAVRLLDGLPKLRRLAVTAHSAIEAVRSEASARGIEVVGLDEIAGADLIVTASSAVTRRGQRVGAGLGTTDLSFGIMRENGGAPVPVATIVDLGQVVRFFPTYEHDVDLSWIATPDELIEVPGPVFTPKGVRWERLEDHHWETWPQLSDKCTSRYR